MAPEAEPTLTKQRIARLALIGLAISIYAVFVTRMFLFMGGPIFWYGIFVVLALCITYLLRSNNTKKRMRAIATYIFGAIALFVVGEITMIFAFKNWQHHQFEASGMLPLPNSCAEGDLWPGGIGKMVATCGSSSVTVLADYKTRFPEGWTVRTENELYVVSDAGGQERFSIGPGYPGGNCIRPLGPSTKAPWMLR